MQKHKKYGEKGNMTPVKVNSSIMMESSDSEVDEISKD
jgi:hypothetical protein